MKFYNFINEKIDNSKSTSAVVNKVGKELKKILPIVWYDNKPYRLGLGVLAGNKCGSGLSNPITCPGYPKATGIAIYIDDQEKAATVMEITSASPGMGKKMIEAMLIGLPKDYKIYIHHDWSGGWWEKIMEKYSDREWVVS